MCFGASVLLRKASALKRIDVRYGPQNARMGGRACLCHRPYSGYSPGGQSEGRRNGYAVHLSDLR